MRCSRANLIEDVAAFPGQMARISTRQFRSCKGLPKGWAFGSSRATNRAKGQKDGERATPPPSHKLGAMPLRSSHWRDQECLDLVVRLLTGCARQPS